MDTKRQEMLESVKNIHDYAKLIRSYLGSEHINEWSGSVSGGKYPKPMVCFNTGISRDSIKRLVDAMGDTNPLYRDNKYAEQTKYGTLIAPPTWPYSIVYGYYQEFLHPDYLSLYCGDEFEWFLPAAEGDDIDWLTTFPTEVTEKTTRTGGECIFTKGTHEFKRHQGGEPLCRQTFTTCHLEMKKSEYNDSHSGADVPAYDEEYIQKIYDAWAKEKVRGAEPRWFEDVTVGESLPGIARGPLTVMEVQSWIHAASQYIFCSDKLGRYIHEATGWGYYDQDLNMWLNFHENEYDAYGVMAKRTGSYAPGGFGSQRCAWAMTMISNWMSDAGFLWKMKVRHDRKGGYFNTFWTNGTVTDKRIEDGHCVAEIEIKTTDRSGETVMTGSASVILPSKEKGSIIYPTPMKPFKSFSAMSAK